MAAIGGKNSKPVGAGSPSTDWEEVGADITQECVFMDIMGLEGSGKTRLALSAPGPVALIDGAEKTGGVMNRVVAETGKVIRRHKYIYTLTDKKEEDRERAEAVLVELISKYRDAMNGWARSVVFDTGNRLWELVRLSHHGVLRPKGNRMDALYGPPNAEIRGLLADEFRAQNRTNVITIHQMGDKYIDKMVNGTMTSMKTGKYERKGGFKEIPFIADIVVECVRTPTGGFAAIVRKGWVNPGIEGIEADEEMLQALGYSGLNFSSLLAWITDMPEDKWS